MASRSWRLALLAVALAFVGCGQTSQGSETIRIASTAVRTDGAISANYRCGAGAIWFPLKWGSLPSDTKELIVYYGRFKQAIRDDVEKPAVPYAALIANIDPTVHGIAVNTLPPESSFAYFNISNSCPPVSRPQHVLVELFALDHKRPSRRLSADFVTGLTEEALNVGRFSGNSAAETKLSEESLAVSHFTATYGPG